MASANKLEECPSCGWIWVNADHCTPEERAVIALAEQYYELTLMQGGTRQTLSELREAVGVMFTARAGKETG